MKLPQAYTNLAGKHEVRADQTHVNEVYRSEGIPVDVEQDQSQVSTLDLSWLPFAAKTYQISPKIEDYVIVSTPICPSNLSNRNGIAFSTAELTRYMPPPVSNLAYRAWIGTPMHLEHDNEDCTKAYGVVIDASFRQIQEYGNGHFYKVMGLAAIDKNKHPDIAQKIMDKEINTYSMGALADELTCSICQARAFGGKKRYMNCRHITSTDDVNFKIINDNGVNRLVHLWAHFLQPIELSIVEDPAWAVALSDEVLA